MAPHGREWSVKEDGHRTPETPSCPEVSIQKTMCRADHKELDYAHQDSVPLGSWIHLTELLTSPLGVLVEE